MKKILSLIIAAVIALSCFAFGCFAKEEYIPSPEQPTDGYIICIWESFDKTKNGYFRYKIEDGGEKGTIYFEGEINGTLKYDEKTKSGTFELNNGTSGKFKYDDSSLDEKWENPHSFRTDKGKTGKFIVNRGEDIFSGVSDYFIDGRFSFFWIIFGCLFALVAVFFFYRYYKIRKSEKNVSANYYEELTDDMKKARQRYSFRRFKNCLTVIILSAVAILLVAFFIHLNCEKSRPSADGPSRYSDDIDFFGKTYSRRSDVESLLIIGLDKYIGNKNSGDILNNCQSDFIALFVFDKTNKTYRALQLDRDTMVYIDILGKNSEKKDTVCQQLALAHTYGKGWEDSCYNTKKTVSKLLYNVKIDNFTSFTLDSVEIINNALSGVEVNIKDDFSKIDPSLKQGETIILSDKQALTFVEARMGLSDTTNTGRSARHKEYIKSAIKKANALYDAQAISTGKIVERLLPFSCSSLTAEQAVRLIDTVREYKFEGFVRLDGKFKTGENFIEFYPTGESVKRTTVELFYEQKRR